MNKPTKIKRLIYDLETSPMVVYTWRIGYKLSLTHDKIIRDSRIICACYKWEGEDTVHHLEWKKGDDKELCKKLMEVMNEADELVAHNGDKFDMKIANTRFLANGLDPSPMWKTVDTLTIARRHFRFDSNRLDFLGKFLFNEGKIQTNFTLWTDIVEKNCKKAMKMMVDYCKQDVILLEKVWHKLQPYHKPKSHLGCMNGGDKWLSPFTGSQNVIKTKTRITAAGATQHQMKCKDSGGYYTISDSAFKKYQLWRLEQNQK